MTSVHATTLWNLLEAIAGTARTARLFATLDVDGTLLKPAAEVVSRAELAQALNMLLFDDLLRRVPEGQAYIEETLGRGGHAFFDHGALRTFDHAANGALPRGHLAFARILEPLGFRVAGVYPLTRLKATGRAFAHQDCPEGIAQFFVSEIHMDQFSPAFQAAAARITEGSTDPLPAAALPLLGELTQNQSLPFDKALRLLPNLVACFDRQHPIPSLSDYETLLGESHESAWFATEGNAYNHATDRVDDVLGKAEELKQLGIPMKDVVETSQNGRVFQTATRATQVLRPFRDANGHVTMRTVPGSFYEFITRKTLPEGGLDLTFDAGNATAIFKMTNAQ